MLLSTYSDQFKSSGARAWPQQVHALLSLPVACTSTRWASVYIVLAFILHLLVFLVTLNAHFTSPAVPNIPRAFRADLSSPPARRVVLFIVDGLRADALFRHGLSTTPHLRRVVFRRGAWAVSHARAPCMSRSGHLALLAGVNEGAESLTRGRGDNPFDSAVNRSRAAWLVGDDEIVATLSVGQDATAEAGPTSTKASKASKAARAPHVHCLSLPEGLNDFSMRDPTDLDRWAFRRLEAVLAARQKAADRHGPSLLPGEGKELYMVHLLGVDTFSHARATTGEGLRRVLAHVDKGIEQAERQFEAAFNRDGRTAFLVTADHGMSSSNSHVAGDRPSETETPLVAWGAGVRRPRNGTGRWGVPRRGAEMEQVDVCPLVAALLGLRFPVHSEGRVPLELVRATASEKAELARANALQILEHFLALRRKVKAEARLLSPSETPGLSPAEVTKRLRHGELLATAGRSAEATAHFQRLSEEGLAALHRLHRRLAPAADLACGLVFALVPLCALLSALPAPAAAPGVPRAELGLGLTLLALLATAAALDAWPLSLGLTWAGAGWLLWAAYRNADRLRAAVWPSAAALRLSLSAAALLQLIVLGFGLRPFLTLVLAFHVGLEVVGLPSALRSGAPLLLLTAGSGAMALFVLLPTVGSWASPGLVGLGALLTACAGLASAARCVGGGPSRAARALVLCLVALLLLAAGIQLRAQTSVRAGRGLPPATTELTRSTMAAALTAVLCAAWAGPPGLVLLCGWLGATAVLALVGTAAETAFALVFGGTLGAWMRLHASPDPLPAPGGVVIDEEAKDTSAGLRTAARLISYAVFVYCGLFGFGNYPTVSSYDPKAVLCFQAAFDLAVMGVVMFLRTFLPVLLATGPLLVVLTDVNVLQLFRGALALADLVAVQFFVRVCREAEAPLVFAADVNHFTIAMGFVGMISFAFVASRLILSHRL